MNDTYTKIMEQSTLNFGASKLQLILEYKDEKPALPAPLNLIGVPFTVRSRRDLGARSRRAISARELTAGLIAAMPSQFVLWILRSILPAACFKCCGCGKIESGNRGFRWHVTNKQACGREIACLTLTLTAHPPFIPPPRRGRPRRISTR